MTVRKMRRALRLHSASAAAVAALLAPLAASDSASAQSAVVSRYTGADAGEGLDLDGNFRDAVFVGGPVQSFQIRDANFVDETLQSNVVITADSTTPFGDPGYGNSANDHVLRQITDFVRWGNATNVGIDLDNLAVGDGYKLQLLFNEACCNREFDVQVEGAPVLDNFNPGAVQGDVDGFRGPGAVITHEFTAGDSTLNVLFPALSGNPGTDGNPIINAVSLEHLPAAPGATTTTAAPFAGGDAGEGLDFEGDIVYAVHMNGPDNPLQLREATFRPDGTVAGVTVTADSTTPFGSPAFHATQDDQDLRAITDFVKWGNGTDVTVDVNNLTPGTEYKLQLLFNESCCERGFDVLIEGQMAVDNFDPGAVQGDRDGTTGDGALITYQFTAADTSLNILLDSVPGQFPDNNPIINAMTLEVVPEPGGAALLAAAGALGLLARRRRPLGG